MGGVCTKADGTDSSGGGSIIDTTRMVLANSTDFYPQQQQQQQQQRHSRMKQKHPAHNRKGRAGGGSNGTASTDDTNRSSASLQCNNNNHNQQQERSGISRRNNKSENRSTEIEHDRETNQQDELLLPDDDNGVYVDDNDVSDNKYPRQEQQQPKQKRRKRRQIIFPSGGSSKNVQHNNNDNSKADDHHVNPTPSRFKRRGGGEGSGLLSASTYNEVHLRAASQMDHNNGSKQQLLRNPNGYRNGSSRRLVSSSSSRPSGVVGLENLGNTCYLNSSLQCLSATIPLTDYFLGYNYKAEINKENVLGTKGKLVTAYGDLMSAIWSSSSQQQRSHLNLHGTSSSSLTKSLLKTFKSQLGNFAPQFQGFQQHDAQEVLAILLDGIHEDLNRIQQKHKPYIEDKDCDGNHDERDAMEAWKNYLCRNKSIIVDIFQGQMRSSLTCLHCQHKNVRFEPFMYLSLPMKVDPNTNKPTTTTLQDCMELYLAPEKLTGENQWYCSQCKTHRDAMKKTDIWILPPILIVHLKRFQMDDFGNCASKNCTPVEYPIENWDLHEFVQSQSSDIPIYDLYAVSNHYGSGIGSYGGGGGHYTAYAMSRFGNEEWYEFNDSQTRQISEETLQQNQSAAYLLFYNRRRTDNSLMIQHSNSSSSRSIPTYGEVPANNDASSAYIAEHPKQQRHNQRQSSRKEFATTIPTKPGRIPLVRRQSVNRPDLWPHTQVHDHQFREFSRSSIRVMEVDVLVEEPSQPEQEQEQHAARQYPSQRHKKHWDDGGKKTQHAVEDHDDLYFNKFETSLKTTREVHWGTSSPNNNETSFQKSKKILL